METHSWLLITIASCLITSCGSTTNGSGRTSACAGEITASSDCAVVKIQSGKVAGYIEEGTYIYKGIPYAAAERFMPPTAPKPWDDVRSSRAYGPTAPQEKRVGWYMDQQAFAFNWNDGFSDEDCLRLNIWTPSINDNKKRPVMVWLHGGGFSAGSGQELPAYDGTNLSRNGDVVVVTLNHRLNVLGFLDLSAFGEKYAKSGNVGLLDLVTALQWVKDNISEFGGDSSNVTLFGQSGGGGKVSTLLATPSAKGLFHKAIVQSGSMLRTMESKYSRRIGVAVMEELGLKATDIDALQQIPYEQLLAAGNKAIAKVRAEADKDGFTPFIFGWAPTVNDNVLPTQPCDSKAYELSKDVPMLIGSTQHEFLRSAYVPELKNITMESAKKELEKQYGGRTDEFLKAFAKAYPGHKVVDLFDTDLIFRPGVVQQATLKASQQRAPVYMYMFAWESPVMAGIFRSFHCMELPFVFDNIYLMRHMTGASPQAYVLAKKMSRAWINFARVGNPNTDDLPEWEPYVPKEGATMFFDNTCEVKHNHDKELLEIVFSYPIRGF